MDQENYLSPHQGLNLIMETIIRTKDNFRENSFCFLLWGWLISAASFISFFLHRFTSYTYYHLPFPILAVAGILVTILYFIRKASYTLTQTYLSFFLARLWMVVGISFIVVVIISITQNLLPFTYTLIIAGIGTLVSGLVMNFKPLIAGGILFMIAAFIIVFAPANYKELVHGIAMVGGYVIPGYLLKYSKQQP